ncbi:formylglycine-generating enzyme family protein [Pseudomonas chlororaphis]|uniref:formylglycine-generating enzyme family protein n=1 Tax=Pseudomonas chlororaphis TaxID=587753 RepID=UPI0021824AA8|nr:formylglycine-generating enzyme family protein [Pseudomonas chlororaphis]WDH35665.1 formylglycine-generating enzyme family protein [Pseudomonas chlororaphis]WDH41750.1 formylglycine-generating enzyme family protein [Pseudomonas chlororaphis]
MRKYSSFQQFFVMMEDGKVYSLMHFIRILPVLRQLIFSLPAMLFLVGCEAESGSLPSSKSLSPEKIASIAATIKTKYPNISSDQRNKVLATVVQSIDNMVFVEGGQFDMGDFGWACEYDEKDVCNWPCGQKPEQLCNISRNGDDDFVHAVKLSSYYLAKFQTTIGEFDTFFISQNKELFDAEYREREDLKQMYSPKLPAPTKSWQEAKDYCQWLGGLSGYPVDLPTEAQWEFAARNRGLHILFPTNNGNLIAGKNFPVEGEGETFVVDRFSPNPLGIYNLSGNATDWVNDWYAKDYYQKSPVDNPQGPKSGTQKVKRGSNYPEAPLSAAPIVRRWPENPNQDAYYPGTGFRCSIQSDKSLKEL